MSPGVASNNSSKVHVEEHHSSLPLGPQSPSSNPGQQGQLRDGGGGGGGVADYVGGSGVCIVMNQLMPVS